MRRSRVAFASAQTLEGSRYSIDSTERIELVLPFAVNIMNMSRAPAIGTLPLLASGATWAQSGHMMNGGWWGGGWMGGYGGIWTPILLVIVIVGVVLMVVRRK